MRATKTFLIKLRLYWPAVVLYGLVAMYFTLPQLTKTATAEQVKVTLTQVQRATPPVAIEYTGHPNRLTIERLGIDFSIKDGVYDASRQSWTLDGDHVFVDASTNQNPVISTDQSKQPHKVLFYGHHTPTVLGKTDNIVPGDILTITTDDGIVFSYYYVSDETADPNDVTILNKARESTPIALLTCGGGWDQFRRIMYFAPLKAVSPKTITNERTL